MIERILDWLVGRGKLNSNNTFQSGNYIHYHRWLPNWFIGKIPEMIDWTWVKMWPKKTTGISWRHQWFLREVTSEEREQRFSTDDVSLSISADIPQT